MRNRKITRGHGFSTLPVFLAAISTILGAVMFLRFGWAVGHQGILGALLIVIVGHCITVPTALAISEIATNRKVEGGGEYYIISRSFGTNIGSAIGISLYLSQAISVAFYLIAFAQAFVPLYPFIEQKLGFTPVSQMFSLPMAVILAAVVLKRGASMGVYMLYGVVAILTVSLAAFFAGGTWDMSGIDGALKGIPDHLEWAYVFSVCFPAFTGMTAGVGLSGDLKNPRRSIPLGTMLGTAVGFVVYILLILKLAANASPSELAGDELIMARVALWGPIIPIGLAAATLSSAIGSLLIAPRTLQALAGDGVFPWEGVNRAMSKGMGKENEPLNATLITTILMLVIVMLGNVNLVAGIISQFFMVTYGSLCLISFLEHFSANPSYRPVFRSRWWVSLIGAVACFVMMLNMNLFTAAIAILIMVLLYRSSVRSNRSRDLAMVFKGALYQASRWIQIWLQKKRSQVKGVDWRPSFIAISDSTFDRLALFDLLRWLSQRYGFGTYFHFIPGRLDSETNERENVALEKVIRLAERSHAGIYAATIISPSFTTAVAQIIQVPGVSGMDNNGLLLELNRDEMTKDRLDNIRIGINMALSVGLDICLYRSSDYRSGYRSSIHIWITRKEFGAANLMILLAYIIMGHEEWKGSEISVFAAVPEDEQEDQRLALEQLIMTGRIPISTHNVTVLPYGSRDTYEELVSSKSQEADLVMVGFTPGQFMEHTTKIFERYRNIRDLLFVCAAEEDIAIVTQEEAEESILSGEETVEGEPEPEPGLPRDGSKLP